MAFGRLSAHKADQPMSEINVTPLVDVMLVLLVIFIVTAPLMSSAIRLDLPSSEAGEPGAAPQSMALVVNAQGVMFMNDQVITADALRLKLRAAAQRNPLTELELRADASVPYGRVVEAMGLAQKAGLSRIGFVAQVVSP
ncbi:MULTISPECIES: biopolymer transporter ExbD [unclassified Limnohabitans]|jgi:biopolymer transport protein TolR|uniref:ExbD/TolR family protein n=1 Tax=unclassified Limnohabitans TaxID=2626134 RepID=UPI000A7BB31C|nr:MULTISPECIES: biopolymer transporter ExbD [unclassified Limnohabitans]PUE15720.1 biopolymer transporter ExbD [Limnohabitans sp. WS1]